MLVREFEHGLRHGHVAVLVFGLLRREDDRVVGRLRCPCEIMGHLEVSLRAQHSLHRAREKSVLKFVG